MNYLDQLLEKIEDAEARQQFTDLASKHRVVGDWIVNPEQVRRAQEFNDWAHNNWDEQHGMTRAEYSQAQQIEQQRQQIEQLNSRGNGMELNELDAFLGKYIKDNGLMTKTESDAQLAEKEKAFGAELNVMTTLATRIPYLNQKHQTEFGVLFEPDEFVTKAAEKGYARFGKEGLDKFYDEYTSERRAAKAKEDQDRLIVDAEKRGEQRAAEKFGMGGTQGAGPTIDGSPEMGHFESKLKGIARTDPNVSQAPVDAELGRGTIARFAALAADARDRGGLVN